MNLRKKLSGLKQIFFETHASNIDSCVFTLHYKVTAFILIACSVLVMSKQLTGVTFDCHSRIDSSVATLNCWIHPTFSLPDAWEKEVGGEIPYPGIDKYSPGEKRVYHTYYPWVGLMLLIQGFFFYIPRYFWKAMEGGRIRNLILGLDSPVLPSDTARTNRSLLVQYLVNNMNNHNIYFRNYVIAEIMNFVNVLVQFFLMNSFLGGEFSTYGLKVMQFTRWDSSIGYNPIIRVFPRASRCIFYTYGSSGDVQLHSATCILPINMVNDKIYLFLWFWFVILGILSGLVLLYRSATVFSLKIRMLITLSHARVANQKSLKAIMKNFKIGDWFLLDLLSKNIDPVNFRDVIYDLAERLDGKKFEDGRDSNPVMMDSVF